MSKTRAEIKEYQDKWYKANSEKVKARVSAWQKGNQEKVKEYKTKWRKKNPWYSSYLSARHRCSSPFNASYKYYGGKGIRFHLTIADFKLLWFRDGAFLMKLPSIDRRDSNKDYILSNCRFIEQSENSSRSIHNVIGVRECKYCEKEFMPRIIFQKYCTSVCRKKYYRYNKKRESK